MTNYDKLKDDIVTLHSDKTDAKIFTVEGFVKYLNQTPQILDKVEKRYIRNIVAPFWKIVKYVVKITDATNEHYYINIVYTDPL